MNPRCQWPGCECEARGPRSKWCVEHFKAKRNETERRAYAKNPAPRKNGRRKYRAKHRDKVREWNNSYYERNKEKVLRQKRERESNPELREARLARRRELDALKRREATLRKAKETFMRKHTMQECPRLHLRALVLPCGKTMGCSGCDRIGGRRVEFAETGFKFGRVMG